MIVRRYGDFTADGKAALEASHDYFLWWYTAKSVGLVIASIGLAFALGRATKK